MDVEKKEERCLVKFYVVEVLHRDLLPLSSTTRTRTQRKLTATLQVSWFDVPDAAHGHQDFQPHHFHETTRTMATMTVTLVEDAVEDDRRRIFRAARS